MTRLASNDLIWLTVVLFFAACGEPAEIRHPTADNLPSDGSALVRSSGLPDELVDDDKKAWVAVRDLLAESEVIAEIGSLGLEPSEESPYVFGWPSDARFDIEGNVLVLDRLARDVRVFDALGLYLYRFGRGGDGPGEFRDPRGLEMPPGGRILVGDVAALDFFARSDSGYVHVRREDVGRVGEGLCYSSGHLFFPGWSREANELIRKVSVSGTGTTKAFGQGYRSSSWLVQRELSVGLVACVGDPARVVFAFQLLPVLRAYSAAGGKLLWTSLVEDYEQSKITEYRDRGAVGHGSGVYEMALALVGVRNRFVLYQTTRGSRDAPEEMEVRSYLVDAESGHGAFVGTMLPLVTDISEARLLGYRMYPFPRVEIRKLGASSVR